MKRLIALILVLLLCLPAGALAMSQKDWDQMCVNKTGAEVTLYAVDVAADGTKSMRETGVLPAGTYLQFSGGDYDLNLYKITYLADGRQTTAYASREADIVDAKVSIRFTDGYSTTVPELTASDPSALRAWIDRVYPSGVIADDVPVADVAAPTAEPAPEPTMEPEPEPDDIQEPAVTEEPTAAPTAEPTMEPTAEPAAIPTAEPTVEPTAEPAPEPAMEPETEQAISMTDVELIRLGSVLSIVKMDGQEVEVATADLVFAPDVPEEQKIASIHAPSSGKCTLRAKASDKSKALAQCKAGTLVAVLEPGKTFTRVLYNGKEGWVLTRCLTFQDMNRPLEGYGLLSLKGNTNGRASINIRHEPSARSRKIAEMPTGTSVTLFALNDEWYEIEANGMHGYVMWEYVTVD